MRPFTWGSFCCVAGFLFSPALLAFALDGRVQIHDPSAVIQCDGRFYCFGSGGIALVSDDGWTWRRGNMPGHIETAPDVFQSSDRFCIYFAANTGAQSRADINMIWSKPLTQIPQTTNGRTVARWCRPTASKTTTSWVRVSFAIRTTDGSADLWFEFRPHPAG